MNFLFQNVAVIVFDHPDEELFQDGNVVDEGVLLERFPPLVLIPFQGLDSCVDVKNH